MNDPIAPTEKMASIGVSPPNMSSSSSSPRNQLAHTALTGVFVVALTCDQALDSGKQPSLEYEKSTLDAAIIQEKAMEKERTIANAVSVITLSLVRICAKNETWKTKPRTPPTEAVSTMARGVANWALLHSSARWNGESKPDIVQMTAMKLIRIQIPLGHSVKLVIPHAMSLLLNLGRPWSLLVLPPRIMTKEMDKKSRLSAVEPELIQAIHLVGSEAMMEQTNVRHEVSRYVCQLVAE
ncbi:hypothetical protein OGATHE_001913 [Ogataea polymorpha]|uniref:Uncharacterized protein n=1 Tax=Ogataea polymorpha TaxID=460523 RepID=A0A9P8PKF7_9ASCO|nr:hypothetical protein OGATHE_001913 [Ogataea polymorpha]